MILYQKRQLPSTDVGEPGDLPAELVGLQDISLADLIWTDAALGYHGFGYFPVEVDDPPDMSPYVISKELLIERLTTMGKLDEVVAAITTEGMLIWSAADYAAPDNVHLLYLLNAAGLTEGQITTLTARP